MANADPKLSHFVAEPIGTSLEEEIFSEPGVVSLAWKGKRVRVNSQSLRRVCEMR